MKEYIKLLPVVFICGILFIFTGCGGKSADTAALESIYSDYHRALHEENIEALKGLLSAERQKELLDEDVAMKLKLVKQFLPANIKVTGSEVSGDKAILKTEGQSQEQKANGTVEFIKEGGSWKVSKENWQMIFEITDSAGSQGSSPGGMESFIKDPKKLPQPLLILNDHQGEVTNLAFTPDNRFLVSASYGDYSIRVWDPVNGQELSSAKTENRVRSMVVTPDSAHILTADVYQYVISWPLEEGVIGAPRTLCRDVGDTLAVNTTGKLFVTAGLQKPMQLWSLEDGSLVEQLSDDTDIRSFAFSQSGKWLACGKSGNQYWLLDTKTWGQKTYNINKVAKNSFVSAIDISKNDKYLATGHMDSSIVIFDLEEREELHNFYVTDASTWDVKFSPDSMLLATAQHDKNVYLWDVQTSARIGRLSKHTDAVRCLAFSPDGTTLTSGGEDRKIIIWRNGPVPEQAVHRETATPESQADGSALSAEVGEPEMMELEGRKNLIKNPYASQNLHYWQTKGDVLIEMDEEANPFFVIRYSGMLWQDVPIPESTGRWALLIAWASSERINKDDDQTGLPYLYGEMLNRNDKNSISSYLQGQQMQHSLQKANEWGVLWGVFQVPENTGAIRFLMQQADGRTAQNGSSARFDEPGIFIFDTEEEAKDFVKIYRQ
jgi:WD40 repeat protein